MRSKKPNGLSQNETVSTGITGQSSGRVTWWMPKTYQSTTSVLSIERFCAVHAGSPLVPLALDDELAARPALVRVVGGDPERVADHLRALEHGRRRVHHRREARAGHELVGDRRAEPVGGLSLTTFHARWVCQS